MSLYFGQQMADVLVLWPSDRYIHIVNIQWPLDDRCTCTMTIWQIYIVNIQWPLDYWCICTMTTWQIWPLDDRCTCTLTGPRPLGATTRRRTFAGYTKMLVKQTSDIYLLLYRLKQLGQNISETIFSTTFV